MMTSSTISSTVVDIGRRRQAYRRSKTVAELPADHVIESSLSGRRSSRGSTGSGGVFVAGGATPPQSSSSSSDIHPVHHFIHHHHQYTPPPQQQQPSFHTGSIRLPGSGHSSQRRRHRQQHPAAAAAITASSGHPVPTEKPLGRVPSSPSVLLCRVRDIIREKVVDQTRSLALDDGPRAAAIERERRQRAADAYEAARRRRQERMSRQSTASSSQGGGGASSFWRRSDSGGGCGSGGGGSGSIDESTTSTSSRRSRTRSDPAGKHGSSSGGTSRPGSNDRLKTARLTFGGGRSISEDCSAAACRRYAVVAGPPSTGVGYGSGGRLATQQYPGPHIPKGSRG